MNNLKTTVLFILSLTVFFGCREKEDIGFKGANYIQIKTEKNRIYNINTDEGKTKIDIMLTSSVNKDVELSFRLSTHEASELNKFCKIVNPKLTILKGEKTASLEIQATGEAGLEDELTFKIELDSSNDDRIKLKEAFPLTIEKFVDLSALSEEQKQLYNSYKKDPLKAPFLKLLGKKKVSLNMVIPKEDNFQHPYNVAGSLDFEGITTITLSDYATAETMVFNMVENAMGLRKPLHDIINSMTIQNEFWTNDEEWGPVVAKLIRKKIGTPALDAKFEISYDSIAIIPQAEKEAEIRYSVDGRNNFNEPVENMNFKFYYEPWEKFWAMRQAGDIDIKSFEEDLPPYGDISTVAFQEFTINPDLLLNITRIDQDYNATNGAGNFFKHSAKYDKENNCIVFYFPMEYYNAYDYMKIRATIYLD